MGASYSVEQNKPDLEAPEVEADIVKQYEEEYDEPETLDTLFFYWWY